MSARTDTLQKLAEMVRSGQRADSADSAVRAPGFQQLALKMRPRGVDYASMAKEKAWRD